MLYFYTGSDTVRLREAVARAVGDEAVRITDAHALVDLQAALSGGGMFAPAGQAVVLDHVRANAELWDAFLRELDRLRRDPLPVHVIESDADAATRKQLEKYAVDTVKHEAPKQKQEDLFFKLANALQDGKRKDLWVLLQREFAAGKPAEAVHGSLFWAAKQRFAKRADASGARMIARLAELPHEARRNGFELEYALERFVLAEV